MIFVEVNEYSLQNSRELRQHPGTASYRHILILYGRRRCPYAAGFHGYLIGERGLQLSIHQTKQKCDGKLWHLAFFAQVTICVWPYPHITIPNFLCTKYPTLPSINKVGRKDCLRSKTHGSFYLDSGVQSKRKVPST